MSAKQISSTEISVVFSISVNVLICLKIEKKRKGRMSREIFATLRSRFNSYSSTCRSQPFSADDFLFDKVFLTNKKKTF
jgi:hypothetical protein